MESFQLDDIMAMEPSLYRSNKVKATKRKWREIEAIQDKRQLQKELMELDYSREYKLDDIEFN
ncbi:MULTISPECIES: DUF3545 family protein [Vibrio]|uniref:DUF3545 family protein n=1 Tax=Vibrio casei TaxID=673372 RepID=A0A368LKZ6_9VIBR|nr:MULTISPECIES: DUF3545 family protein [Vibrio]RCS72570.1 DUF3545 family protein [Vibrio casei]SJN35945.1 hypothetical protein FM109_13680 [Vibrio casei]HBV75083.1 DUF3545 domain-containing protein [Vibrio sp.]